MPRQVLRRRSAAIIAAAASLGITLQFFLLLREALHRGTPLLPAIARFFTYFTILNNLLVAWTTSRVWLRDRSAPAIETAVATYIAVVGIVYSLVLRSLWNPVGLGRLADELLHDVIPVAYVLWWLLLAHKSRLLWRVLPNFFVWPLIYLAASLVIGAWTNWYPYPFIEVPRLGYLKVLTVSAALLLLLLFLGVLAISYSRWRSPRQER